MHVVPFTEIQMQIHAEVPGRDYTTLIMRRYMMRIAEMHRPSSDGAQALITGECHRSGRQPDDGGCSASTDDGGERCRIFRPADRL